MSATILPPFWADPDAQLMLRAASGDLSGLTKLIEKYYTTVLRYCFHRVRNFAAAEELTQEVFLRVHGSRVRYRPSAKFTTWLYRIASNVVLNWLRDTDRERGHARLDGPRESRPEFHVQDSTVRADEWLAREERAAELRQAIRDLPERQRAAVVLHAYEEMGGLEIARELGCSHQAARSLLFRAYGTLRGQLSDQGENR